MASLASFLEGLKNDKVLGDGWTWSRAFEGRASSNKWRMSVKGQRIEIRPARALRGTEAAIYVYVDNYALLKMIALTYCENIEQHLERIFTENQ